MILLTCITVLAGFLRFYGLGHNPLWLDEVVTSTFSQESFWGIFTLMERGEYNPPLFYWIEHVVIGIFGTSEVALRAVPALLGTLAVIPAYYIGREVGGKQTGYITAFMLAISSFAIYFSQEARAYSLVMLLMTTGLYFYLKALETDHGKHWVAAILFLALGVWAHFYSLVFIAALLIGTVLFYHVQLRKLLLVYFTMAGAVLPVVYPIFTLFFRRVAHEVANGHHGLDVITLTITDFSLTWPIAVIFMALLIWSVAFRPCRKKNILLIYAFLPMLVGIPVSDYITMIPRYLIAGLVPFLVIVADSYKPFTEWMGAMVSDPRGKTAAIILFVVLISVNVVFINDYYTNFKNVEDWRGSTAYLRGVADRDDVIVLVPGYKAEWEFDYYYNKTETGVPVLGAYNLSEIDAACGVVRGTCWLVFGRDNTGKYSDTVKNALPHMPYRTFWHLEIYKYSVTKGDV